MSIESRISAAEKLAAIVPGPADNLAARIPAAVREILADPGRLAEALAWDEKFLGDSADVGESTETSREKDRRAFALLLETPQP